MSDEQIARWSQNLRQRIFAPTMLMILGCLLMTGCQTIHSSRSRDTPLSYQDEATGIMVQRGRPNTLLDGIGWVAGTPTKLAIWDRRADNHDVSHETETALLRYMDTNSLNSSLVRINQYDPWGEWKRLTSNQQISPGWRYTAGVYSQLKYALLPGRIFGGDWYNPFTDTVHVYSDITPLVISRTAYAKDVHSRRYPGTYAVTQAIPFIGMMHHTLAVADAQAYADQYGSQAEQEESHGVLYPDYGSSWGSQIAGFVPFGAPIGRLAGAAVGHAANGVRSTSRSSRR